MKAERPKTSDGKNCNYLAVEVEVEGKPVQVAVSLRVSGLKAANARVLRDILLRILVDGVNDRIPRKF